MGKILVEEISKNPLDRGKMYFVDDTAEPKQTNADRIRNMSDEELANLLVRANPCCHCGFSPEECRKSSCKEGNLQWLKLEVKE